MHNAVALPRSRQAGVSVIELVLYLLAAAVVIIAIFGVFKGAFGATKVQAESNYMQSIVGEVEQMFGTNHDYGTGDITATLVSTKSAPPPLIVGNALRNSWNGSVTVTGASDTFALTTTNVPDADCITLAQVGINPVTVKINNAEQPKPMTGATVASACTAGNNTITWNIR